jgi:hypothetical protein
MRSRSFLQAGVVLLIILGRNGWVGAVSATHVNETPQSNGTTEYQVFNGTTSPEFDVSVFLSTTTGSTPTTTNSDWSTEAINATDWTESMGYPAVSEPPLPTWQQYTGMTYTQAFPSDPIKVNGYYLDYTFNSDGDTVSFPASPLVPGESLGGFFFAGDPGSTFLLAGPADPEGTGVDSLTIGDADTFSGTSVDLPEPASLGLVAIAVCGLTQRRRRSTKFSKPRC